MTLQIDVPRVFCGAVLGTLRIERRDYSSRPWRIVTQDGQEVYAWQSYPSATLPPFQMPICFDRKRDASAWLASTRRVTA